MKYTKNTFYRYGGLLWKCLADTIENPCAFDKNWISEGRLSIDDYNTAKKTAIDVAKLLEG